MESDNRILLLSFQHPGSQVSTFQKSLPTSGQEWSGGLEKRAVTKTSASLLELRNDLLGPWLNFNLLFQGPLAK